MTISTGSRLPEATLYRMGENGPESVSAGAALGQGTVLVFFVPGAFTPTCSDDHLPGYVANAEALRARGVERIVCIAVNDPFVLAAWRKALGGAEGVEILSDGNGALVKALGLELDGSGIGMGPRAQRAAMLLRDGVVETLVVEENPGLVDVSGAPAMLARL